MDIKTLRYFLVVAREGNITRASELLHITQPTLSRQIMQLEEELGAKLFKRSSHGIGLTEDGMRLKKRAQEMVLLAEKTEKEFRQKEDTVSGEIAIGSAEAKSVHNLAERITAFREKYPMVQYDLYTANADDIKERLDRGILDIGLLTEPVDVSKYNFIRLAKRERWGILVHRDSGLAGKEKVTPEDLLQIPLFLVRRLLVKNELAGWFGDYFDHLHIAGTYNLVNNAAVMAENKIGAVLCLDMGNRNENLCFVPLSPAVEAGAVIVWNKNQIHAPAVSSFIEFLKKA